jgi:hypothetical protein
VGNAEYLSYEADANRVREWAVLRIPDLLWTPEYTRALLTADRAFRTRHQVDGALDGAGERRIHQEIDSRRRRQGRIIGHEAEHPLSEYTAVIEEAALRKVVGDAKVMRAQLIELANCAGYAHTTVLVIPEKASAPIGTDGGFTLLEFPNPLQGPMFFAHYPGGVVIDEEPCIIDHARQRFDALISAALPQPDSVELIEQLTELLYPE